MVADWYGSVTLGANEILLCIVRAWHSRGDYNVGAGFEWGRGMVGESVATSATVGSRSWEGLCRPED